MKRYNISLDMQNRHHSNYKYIRSDANANSFEFQYRETEPIYSSQQEDSAREIILVCDKLGQYLLNIAEKSIGEEKINRDNDRLIRYIKKTICRPSTSLAQCAWYNNHLKYYPDKYTEPHNWRAHIRIQQLPFESGTLIQNGYYIDTAPDYSEKLEYSEELQKSEEIKQMAEKYIRGVTTRLYIDGPIQNLFPISDMEEFHL
jgi:hypothetical protein